MALSIAQALAAELEHENVATRRMLERLPDDRFDWRPHEKSWTLGELSAHIARLPLWGTTALQTEELDLSQGPPYGREVPTDRAGVLELYDRTLTELETALAGCSDETVLSRWECRAGEHSIFAGPRVAALRGFVLNHVYHHRGQLSVYLRLLDVPLPQVYGPTADDAGPFGE